MVGAYQLTTLSLYSAGTVFYLSFPFHYSVCYIDLFIFCSYQVSSFFVVLSRAV